MAAPQRLAVLSVAGLAPRRAGGAAVEESAARIRSALSARLGADHALLFATPERRGAELAWTTQAEGAATRLDKLDPALRARAMARMDKLLADVKAIARRMLAEPGPARATGEALLAVARPPSPSNVFVAGGAPVIVMWTHDDAPPTPPPAARTAAQAAATAPPPRAAYAALALGAICLVAAGAGLVRSHAAAQTAAGPGAAALKQQLDRLSAADLSHCSRPTPAN